MCDKHKGVLIMKYLPPSLIRHRVLETKKPRLLRHSLNSKIFFAYGAVFLLLVIIAANFYYLTSYHNFLENRRRTSSQLAKIISNQTDQYIEKVNSIQKRILENDSMIQYIFEEASLHDVTKDWAFRKGIYSITGYDLDFYHMNIVNLADNTLITFGQEYYYKPYTPDPEVHDKLIQPILDLNGAKRIATPSDPVLYEPDPDKEVFTLSRSFGRYSLSIPKAIIEIQMNVDKLQSIIANTLLNFEHSEETVLIFDQSHKLVYPTSLSDSDLVYYTSLDTSREYLFKHTGSRQTELIASCRSEDSGFSVMLVTPESYIVQNKQIFLQICLLFFACAILILMLITYRIARSITSPIIALKEKVSSLDLEQLGEKESTDLQNAGFNELEILNDAFNRMQVRLKRSMDDTIASRTLTIHSQMMALQAQMDSHFLYNTLTIISIIAEENDDEQASVMCIKLTEMLRYITEDISKATTFEQEWHHTRNYTDLMSIRFGSKIRFCYEYDSQLRTIPIPRLIIQPIVENCVKYSRKDSCILEISIRSFTLDGCWYVNIRDNGDGFSPEAIESVNEKIRGFDTANAHPVLSIDGMGLANIYLRLHLYYTENFTFKLENIEKEGTVTGASITIGGILA